MIEQKSSDEIIQVTFPYADEIGVAAITAQVITASVFEGVDASPASVLLGVPQAAGSEVRQLVQNGVVDVRYKLHCLTTFNDGRKLARTYVFEVLAP